MRTVGLVQQALEGMCERALSRWTQGELLAQKQLVQDMIAESWIQIEQFRLLVMRTAWRIDKYNDYQRVRADISGVKAAMPQVLHDVAARAVQIHGSLGVSWELPYAEMVLESFHMGLADGATEVHKVTLARQILKNHRGTDDLFPTGHLPRLEEEARCRYADVLAAHGRA
jgi:acyl-CoA dehydrogenase